MKKKKINEVLSVSAQLNKKTNISQADLYVYGFISQSESFFDDTVTPKQILSYLQETDNVSVLNLHINSNGGSVTAGHAMMCLLNDYRVKTGCQIHAYIEGIAASMGSALAMTADKIYMNDNSMLMIHNPLLQGVSGNAEELRAYADIAEKYQELVTLAYKKHFKGTDEQLEQYLSDETLFSPEEALDVGLCDEIIESIQLVACANNILVNDFLVDDKKIVDKIKGKFKNIREEEQVEMKYENSLQEKHGISEEQFNAFSGPMAFYEHIEAKCKENFEENKPEVFLTLETAKEKLSLSEDITAEEVLALAVKGQAHKDLDPSLEVKATQYDKLFSALIKDTLSDGVKALGQENFKEETWKKMLENQSYDEVKDIQNTWVAQAKLAFNAGQRISVKPLDVEKLQAKQERDNENINF